MIVKLLTEHHLECLSLKEGCTGWSESTLVKMPHCRKSHVSDDVTAQIYTLPLKMTRFRLTKNQSEILRLTFCGMSASKYLIQE